MATSRLRKLRVEAGYNDASTFAKKYDIPEPTYRSAENGTRPPTVTTAKACAKILTRELKRDIHWLYLVNEIPTESIAPPAAEALLVGKVGAGAEIVRFDNPDVLEGVPLPSGLNAPNAAVIEGDSQYPLREGWLVFYGPEHQGVLDELLGKLCVVQVNDGPTLLKTPKRGSRKGLYHLESWNAPVRDDQKLDWAALVLDIRPKYN